LALERFDSFSTVRCKRPVNRVLACHVTLGPKKSFWGATDPSGLASDNSFENLKRLMAATEADADQLTLASNQFQNLLSRKQILRTRDERIAVMNLAKNNTSDIGVDGNLQLYALTARGKQLLQQLQDRNQRINDIRGMDAKTRFKTVIGLLVDDPKHSSKLGQAVVDRLKELAEPANLGIFVGIAGVTAVAQFTPIGPAVDAAVGLLGLALFGRKLLAYRTI
jgi:hypothetical protein